MLANYERQSENNGHIRDIVLGLIINEWGEREMQTLITTDRDGTTRGEGARA